MDAFALFTVFWRRRRRVPALGERHLLRAQHRVHVLDLLDAGGFVQVDDEKRRVRALQRSLHPAHRMLGCDRGKIDELDVNVLKWHHPGLRKLRRERIRRVVRTRSGEPRVQQRLAGVRRTDQRDLRCALGTDDERRSAVAAAAPHRVDLVGELLDACLDVGLQPLGALVFGDRAQHFAQAIETLARLARLAVGGLGGLVFRAEVGGHDVAGVLRPYIIVQAIDAFPRQRANSPREG